MGEDKHRRRGGVHDVIGVGFGPSNLALAVAMEEDDGAGRHVDRLFLEARRAPAWHPGMLIDDCHVQITVLKDLVTLRNPQSRFSFLCYLKEKGRLFKFLNLRDLYPTRAEFSDYLAWAAAQFQDVVRYGREVVSITPEPGEARGRVDLLRVTARDCASGEHEEHLTRNLVLAVGGSPEVPQGIELRPGGRVFHAQELVQRLARDYSDRDGRHRFVVVGAGQSAAEIFHHLITTYRRADVTATIRRIAYKPLDDSDFINEIFFPEMVDFLYDLPEHKRRYVLDQCKDVNYAVIDPPLIRKIYRALYEQEVAGEVRARVRPFLELRRVSETPQSVVAEFFDLLREEVVRIEADALILGTGYAWRKEHPLLAQIAPYLVTGSDGRYRVLRDYRLASEPGFAPKVFVPGFAEESHGAAEPVMSLLPIRAGDILRSLLGAAQAT